MPWLATPRPPRVIPSIFVQIDDREDGVDSGKKSRLGGVGLGHAS